MEKTMKKLSIIILLFFFACAPTVQMKVLKPARLPIRKSVKRIAVLDFNFKGNWNLGQTQLTEKEIKFLKFRFKMKQRKPVFDKKRDQYTGAEVASKLIAALVNNGYYQVVERQRLRQIMQEQKLALSGVVDESTAVQVGELLGIEALLVGNGNYTVTDKGEWRTYKKKIRRNKKTIEVPFKGYFVTREVNVTLNFRIISTETGEVIASNTVKGTTRVTHSQEQPLSYFKSNEMKKLRQMELETRQGLTHWKTLVDNVVDKLCRDIVNQIAPHYVVVKRTLEKGKSKEMKMALEYSKRGLWEDAKKIWESISNQPSHHDKIAAMYNLAIYYEAVDELDKAEQLYDQCFKATGKKKYLDARARVVKRKKELEKLKEQGAVQENTPTLQ